jgi:hypothetical protein
VKPEDAAAAAERLAVALAAGVLSSRVEELIDDGRVWWRAPHRLRRSHEPQLSEAALSWTATGTVN